MKKSISILLAIVLTFTFVLALASCGQPEKNITVVVREQGSGTREAFDKVVTNGEHFLEEKDANGKKVYNTTNTAVQQTKTGTVLSTVASDENAIGYISLGSLNDSVNVVSVEGVSPSEATVLNGSYKIQRPFVVMTNSKVELNHVTADFMNFLKTTPGYIVCILLPFLALILYQGLNCVKLFRQYKREQLEEITTEREQIEAERAEAQKMMAELMALKAQLAQQPSPEPAQPAAPPQPETVPEAAVESAPESAAEAQPESADAPADKT